MWCIPDACYVALPTTRRTPACMPFRSHHGRSGPEQHRTKTCTDIHDNNQSKQIHTAALLQVYYILDVANTFTAPCLSPLTKRPAAEPAVSALASCTAESSPRSAKVGSSQRRTRCSCKAQKAQLAAAEAGNGARSGDKGRSHGSVQSFWGNSWCHTHKVHHVLPSVQTLTQQVEQQNLRTTAWGRSAHASHLQMRHHEHWLLAQVQRPCYRQDGCACWRPLQA